MSRAPHSKPLPTLRARIEVPFSISASQAIYPQLHRLRLTLAIAARAQDRRAVLGRASIIPNADGHVERRGLDQGRLCRGSTQAALRPAIRSETAVVRLGGSRYDGSCGGGLGSLRDVQA